MFHFSRAAPLLSPSSRGVAATLALAALLTSGIAATVSGAFFTDSQTVTGNSFTTGTVDLTASPVTAAITMSNMAPGDTRVGTITVTNAGSLQQRYSMKSTADNNDLKGLASALSASVKVGVTTCTVAGFAVDGTTLYGPAMFGAPAGTAIFGDATAGSQAGDRVLAAGANETLCVQINLPSGTGNALQAATTDAVFEFNAEQVVNNP